MTIPFVPPSPGFGMNWQSLGVSIAVALKAMTLAAPALLFAALSAATVVAAWRALIGRNGGHGGLVPAPAVLLARAPGMAPPGDLAPVRPPVAPRAPRAPRAPPILLLPAQLTPARPHAARAQAAPVV